MNKLSQLFYQFLPLISQLFRFGMVGITAASIHFITVMLLVQNFFLAPLVANIFGFLISFQVSYWGHRLWTFQETSVLHRTTFPKLLLVQVVNFSANETLFYIFLSLHLPYPLALLVVLTILPIFTFVSSKLWVFRV
jgi:putative flippase GtrA